MKRLGLLVILSFLVVGTKTASADWRWAPSHKKLKITYSCATMHCIEQTYRRVKHRYHLRVARYDKRRLHEWKLWTHRYIPTCTWYGESGFGPPYAPIRYVMPNAGGSGAFGKYQFMASTYHSVAKYHDWSALDQEIAARREFWLHGTGPWENC